MLITSLALIIIGSAILVNGQDIDIQINSDENSILVTENISVDLIDEDNLRFFIQTGATDISISVNGNSFDYTNQGNNIYKSNLSTIDPNATTIQISYKLSKDTKQFEKDILNNLSSLEINFNDEQLFDATNLKVGNEIKLSLIEKETKTVETPVETIPVWIYLIIVVLFIVIIILFVRSPNKQKEKTKSESIGGSKELLETKKALLMTILKDIEKQYRAKKISENTYHKLKDHYKNDAVITMKNLEELKSKVK